MSATSQLLSHQCFLCKQPGENLSLCAGCKAVRYCSKEHQTSHWPTHKTQCTPVKKARVRTEKEETALRNHPGDFMTPANPFNQPGHFWGWIDTRDYMRARYGLMDNLRKIKTVEAVQAAHDHALDMHRLCRSDNMGIRSMTPALMIRLGKDQEAYDFLKWYATAGQDIHYDWGNMDLPYLNLKDEDVFEDVSVGEWDGLSALAQLALIKLRLLLDLLSLRSSMRIGSKLPQELIDNIREGLVSNAVAKNKALMEGVRDGIDPQPYIDKIKNQMNTLFADVNESNPHFWKAIARPGSHLTARPEAYSMGSREEMQLMLQYNYEAWEETPGAIEWVKEKLR